MANIEEAIRRLQFLYETHGAEQVAAAQAAITASTTTTEKASLSLEKSFNNLERRYVSTVRAQQDYQRVQDKVNAAIAQNPALQERGNAILANASQQYIAASRGYQAYADTLNKGAAATGLARYELVNLSRQIQDVGVSLASGQSPLSVLVQQGTQIADIFASGTGTVRGFFSQAIGWAGRFVTSTAGIVTGVLAVGAAFAFAAYKFADASKTTEEIMKEEQRLLKETKALLDEKTSLEAKAQAQSKDLTVFQAKQNELRAQIELNNAMREAVRIAGNKASTPTQVPGEMGEAPTAFGPRAGYEKINEAIMNLNAAIAAGKPGIAAFRAELAGIPATNPELTQTVEKLIDLNAEGEKFEQTTTRAKAVSDALKGIATNAQLAAVGLGSIAQFAVSNQMAKEAAAATERQAVATRALAALYPGISIEVAKQLETMNGQLQVAQARTGAEQMITQEYVNQNNYLMQGKTLEEASALAAGQRQVAEENVSKSIAEQIHGLEDQIALSNARLSGNEALVRSQQAYNNAIREGALEEDAAALRKATYRNEEQQQQEQLTRQVQQQADAGADAAYQSEQVARNNRVAAQNAEVLAYWMRRAAASAAFWARDMGVNIENRLDLLPTQFKKDETFVSDYDPFHTYQQKIGLEASVGANNIEPTMYNGVIAGYQIKQSYFDTLNQQQRDQMVAGLNVSSPAAIQTGLQQLLPQSGGDLTAVNRLIDFADPSQQTSLIQQTIDYIRRTEPPGLATEEKIQDLNDKLMQLTNSTDSLNATMQSALSPFYSQDPRTTKLGFRAGVTGNPDWMTGATNANPLVAVLGPGATAPGMASGGSFVVGGGYSANDNRMAVFPVASGEEIVVNRNQEGRTGQVVHIDNRIFVSGSVDNDTLSKMKVSRYQQAQRMRAGMAQA